MHTLSVFLIAVVALASMCWFWETTMHQPRRQYQLKYVLSCDHSRAPMAAKNIQTTSNHNHLAGDGQNATPKKMSSTTRPVNVSNDPQEQEQKEEREEMMINIVIKWMGKSYAMRLPSDSTVGTLKHCLADETFVLPKRQKIIGIKPRTATDDSKLNELTLKKTLMMVGPAEKDLFVDLADEEQPDVLDDLDFDYRPSDEAANEFHQRNMDKLAQYTKEMKVSMMKPLREGKKLLVLDLDYTLVDHKSRAPEYSQLKRPFTDEFLATLSQYYDIVVWSQTSWRWLEMKLTELGLLTNPSFHIVFVLNKSNMLTYKVRLKDGSVRRHQVKALDMIWTQYKQFSAKNTVHIDDVSRNFALNPQSGLKIKAYRKAHVNRSRDKELLYLTRYLVQIAQAENDFTTLDHAQWKEYIKNNN